MTSNVNVIKAEEKTSYLVATTNVGQTENSHKR